MTHEDKCKQQDKYDDAIHSVFDSLSEIQNEMFLRFPPPGRQRRRGERRGTGVARNDRASQKSRRKVGSSVGLCQKPAARRHVICKQFWPRRLNKLERN